MFRYVFLGVMLFSNANAMFRGFLSTQRTKPMTNQGFRRYSTMSPRPDNQNQAIIKNPATDLLKAVRGEPARLTSLSHRYSKHDPFSVWTKNPDGKTVLHLACQEGNLKLVQEILKIEYNEEGDNLISCKDSVGNGALTDAVLSNAKDIVQELCDKHIALGPLGLEITPTQLITSKNNHGLSAWYYAIQMGNPEIVEMFLKFFGDQAMSYILEREADKTPLHWAVEFGHEPIVKMLLQRAGFDAPIIIFAADQNGQTSLDYARKFSGTSIEPILWANFGHLTGC